MELPDAIVAVNERPIHDFMSLLLPHYLFSILGHVYQNRRIFLGISRSGNVIAVKVG